MAKAFFNDEDAKQASLRYLTTSEPVHEIVSEYGVNPYRLYGVLDGTERTSVLTSVLATLKEDFPTVYEKMPKAGKLRRCNFGKVSSALPLFD